MREDCNFDLIGEADAQLRVDLRVGSDMDQWLG